MVDPKTNKSYENIFIYGKTGRISRAASRS
jgi:hypothetical protein